MENKMWVLIKSDVDYQDTLGVFDNYDLALEAQKEQESGYGNKGCDFILEEFGLNVKPEVTLPPPIYHTCLTKEEFEWQQKMTKYYLSGFKGSSLIDKLKEIGLGPQITNKPHYEDPDRLKK